MRPSSRGASPFPTSESCADSSAWTRLLSTRIVLSAVTVRSSFAVESGGLRKRKRNSPSLARQEPGAAGGPADEVHGLRPERVRDARLARDLQRVEAALERRFEVRAKPEVVVARDQEVRALDRDVEDGAAQGRLDPGAAA